MSKAGPCMAGQRGPSGGLAEAGRSSGPPLAWPGVERSLWRWSEPEPACLRRMQAARRGSYESRSALATALSKRWTVEQVGSRCPPPNPDPNPNQVSAQKMQTPAEGQKETHII
eukprot:scaffold63452_cov65-Phaeocystis_antarctica.AAC.9